MAIQEKIGTAFETATNVSYGEESVDRKVVVAEKKLHKDPKTLDKDEGKTLALLEVMQIFATEKGLVGLVKALDEIESKYPEKSLSSARQQTLDTIANELLIQASKFQVETGGDVDLTHQVGVLIRDNNWKEASKIVRDAITKSKATNEVRDKAHSSMLKTLDAIDSDDRSAISKQLIEVRKTKEELVAGSMGVKKVAERVDKIDTTVVRNYVRVIKESTPRKDEVDTSLKVDPNITEKQVDDLARGLGSLSDKISQADGRRLRFFQRELASEWQLLGNGGVDLDNWSRGNQDRQRMIREVHGVVSHILFLDEKSKIGITDEQRAYLKEIARSTSAVKRAWIEDLVLEGESPRINPATPEEVKERRLRSEGIDQLRAWGNASNYIDATRRLGKRDARGNLSPEDDLDQGGYNVLNKLHELAGRGLIEDLEKTGGQVIWIGNEDEFFENVSELARDVSAIVPEVNQIPFSRAPKARLYQMLMESEARPGKTGDLAWAKDAVFRLYTMGYVKEALWKNGGAVEPFTKAALALLGQGGDDSVYSSLFKFHESVKVRGADGSVGSEILKIDLRDMLDFSEQYSRIKGGKRSWLNAISAGTLNEKGDASSKQQRMEYFYDYMKYALDKQLDRGDLTKSEYDKRLTLIGSSVGDRGFERTFDVYGDYYSNLVKVLQAIHLRYGEVAVNQALDGGSFDFCSPPGGEAPYKLHKNTVFKFVARYVPTQKFAQFLDGRVDVGMVSSVAYARKETLPHFCLVHSTAGANPGADQYFFGKVSNESDRKKFAEQSVAFWKPAMFDSDNNPGMEYRDTDELRMVADTTELALKQLSTWDSRRLEFVNHIDYTMLSNASGYKFEEIFKAKGITDPLEKFKYVIQNYGYRYLEWNGLRSKRIGDFYGKYLPENFAGVYKAAIALGQNATSDEAIFEAAKHIDAFSGSTKFIEDIDKVVEELNKWRLTGIRMPKTKGGSGWLGVDEKGEKAKIDRHGDFESTIKGILPGSLSRTSYADYLLRHRDPAWMRPFILEAAFQGGQLSPELFEKKMKDHLNEMYFGPVLKKMKFKLAGKDREFDLRAGYILPALPVFLLRGWFVEAMHLDKEDFWWITKKANKELWAEFKKAFGFK